ncbi:uroporphyrinogen-III C-methyltransferase [Brachybacterium saurashtrense]|uniref:uroporphyrinogen-III C-methyltransferase n=1 Tax=Brachybacterium saurashtrense TaxID=556288 RepID=A0A345YN61_9MICO|nr:uroporphyrinogen-III C-methyltransferase [Brachybacterium saurashtrense]AXK45363.1 uroporphyrinogen-III C-methyltransferase [Brachybacterium saurashtrense]RRR21880.1 uroporphyrinogen-III C-methyltransferase [Brachybacterium saurashtrense]
MNSRTGAHLEPGAVALVGGGPGAWDLITMRGMALLRQADVVVADRLGPRALLDELGADVEVIDVGKRPGAHSMRQDEIGALLVAKAREGRRVVRLKGGDPYVLGRGGEEVLACRAAGIDVQVVPGVTSALAGPASADVPVTHRGTAVAVHVVNAHGDLGPADLAALADPGTTTVLMMGVKWLPRLVSQALLNGIDPATPVAVVQEATLPDQRSVRGTLADIEQVVAEAGIGHPAVIVVGRTAAEGFLRPEEPAAAADVPEHGSGREAVDLPEGDPAPGPSPAPVLIGCSHGTRSRAGRDVLRALLGRIAGQAPGAVREAFVDVQSPDVAAVIAAHARPVEARTREGEEIQAVVVPLLLSLGYHVKDDIGGAVAGRAAVAAAPLGPDPRLAEVMAQRLAEAGLRDGDAVVMAGSGTRDPEGVAQVEEMARQLGRRLGREVGVGFACAATPSVADAVATAREGLADGARVVVASYVLAPGHFHDLVAAAGADVVAAPLGDHPLVAEIALERYEAALGA